MSRLLLLLVLALAWASGCGNDNESPGVVAIPPTTASPSVVTLRLDYAGALAAAASFTVEVFPAPNGPLLLDLDGLLRTPGASQEVRLDGLPESSLDLRVVFFNAAGVELGYADQIFVNQGSPVITVNSLTPTPPSFSPMPPPVASPSPAAPPAPSPSPVASPSPGSSPPPVASPSPSPLPSPTPPLLLQPAQVTLVAPLATQGFTLLQGNVDVSARATWTSSQPEVAAISAAGLAAAVSAGTTIVTATVNGQQAQATLTVTGARLLNLTIAPDAFTLNVPQRAQFTARGEYSDGVTRDLTPLVTWASSVSAVFSVDTHGLLTALSNGSSILSATLGSRTAQISGTVSPRAATPIPPVLPSPTPIPAPSPSPAALPSPTPMPSPSPVLRLAGLAPASGPAAGGNSVTLNGNALTGVTSVSFGGASVPFTISSDTQIVVTAPAGNGAVNVTATSSAGTASLSYGYDVPALTGPHTLDTSADTLDGNPVPGLANGQWNVGSFSLTAGATLTVTGSRAFILNSTNTVQIDGVILARGGAGADAIRAVPGAGGPAGPGGFAGGRGGDAVPNGALAGSGPGGGGFGTGTPLASGGGGGGGHNGPGQQGFNSLAGAGGAAYGANDIPDTLLGGSGGGGGGRSSGAFTQGGGGGGGGGAIRILSTTGTIVVSATASIDVSGGAGGKGTTPPSGNGASGGGGGSGGSVWLTARVRPTVSAGALLLAGGAGGGSIITGAPFTAGEGGMGAAGTQVLEP